MRRSLFIAAAGLLVIALFSAVLWSMLEAEADDPHLPFLDEDNCLRCHDTDAEGSVDGNEFVTAIIGICYECHPPEILGRSHPVDVDLDRNVRFPEMVVPDNLLIGGQWDDLLTCATCHYVHGPWKSKVKAYRTQKPIQNLNIPVPMYKTLYLRIPGNPDGGWETLCDACHVGFL